MIAYYATDLEIRTPRPHPWTTSQFDESQRYVDFKAYPNLIRDTIEDLKPYHQQAFAEEFFKLIEWINGPDRIFESNDFAFRGPSPNIDRQFEAVVRCSARVMILFRRLLDNTDPDNIDRLVSDLISEISMKERGFGYGAVGVSRCATVYMALHPDPKKGALGQQIMISLFAYGDVPSTSLKNMSKVVACVRQALKKIDSGGARAKARTGWCDHRN